MGGRVALLLRLQIGEGDDGGKEMEGAEARAGGLDRRREVVVANTHLLFPHGRSASVHILHVGGDFKRRTYFEI